MTSLPQIHCCPLSLIPAGMFNPHNYFCTFPLIVLPVLLVCMTLWFLDHLPSFSSYFVVCFIHEIKPFLHYFLLYLLYWPFTPLPCQSLCEFYAKHCARIEALRLQLQEEQRGRQVEHTATAGVRLFCSRPILY